jgi:hypothetical protein
MEHIKGIRVWLAYIFAFFRVFSWQADEDPVIVPKRWPVLQSTNSKIYIFTSTGNITRQDGNHKKQNQPVNAV